METVDKIKAKFNPRNRDGVYIRVIQYNTNASRSNCPQGVECQPVGFKEAYARVGKYYNLIHKYKILGNELPIEVNMDGTIGRIAVLISDNHSIGNQSYLQNTIEKYQIEKDLQFLKVGVDDSQNIDEVATNIGQTAFATCFSQLENQVKLSLDVVDESVGYDNKIEVDCHLSGTPFGARPVSFELLKDGISVENKTDENQRYVIGGISDIDLCKFTCSAHYMYGVSISQRVDFVLMAGPPRNLKKNRSVIMKSGESIDIHCHNGRRQDADFSFRFNGNPLPELSNNGGTTYIIKGAQVKSGACYADHREASYCSSNLARMGWVHSLL
uniref:VWFA domain-containing protein n=1 Tax=Romanomermis culicivorax TaxID=13658 RepID=A0A915J8H3_ROMCU